MVLILLGSNFQETLVTIMNIKQILSELVAIDSVSSRSNLEIINFLIRHVESFGMCARMYPYTDVTGIKKFNLVAVYPESVPDGGDIELAIVGHTDTVPYDTNWKEATTLVERDGNLYARGACDTKGFIAAALNAVSNIDFQTLHRPLALVFTADEELGLIGAKRLAAAQPFSARYSIVGEPTSLQPMRAGKGYCLAEVIVRGTEAHSAYPTLGVSAISRAARLVSRIDRIAKEMEAEEHTLFDPPFTTVNVGIINGGTAKNVIAGECRFTLEWRPIPSQAADHALNLLKLALAEEKQLDRDFDCEVHAERSDGGFETSENSRLVSMLEDFTGKAAGTISFGTEAAQMIELGAEAVVLGPGNIRVAHRTGEYVPLDDLYRCTEVLERSIKQLCT